MFLMVVRESATVLLRMLIDLIAIKDERLSVQIMMCWFVFSLHTCFQLPIIILVVSQFSYSSQSSQALIFASRTFHLEHPTCHLLVIALRHASLLLQPHWHAFSRKIHSVAFATSWGPSAQKFTSPWLHAFLQHFFLTLSCFRIMQLLDVWNMSFLAIISPKLSILGHILLLKLIINLAITNILLYQTSLTTIWPNFYQEAS